MFIERQLDIEVEHGSQLITLHPELEERIGSWWRSYDAQQTALDEFRNSSKVKSEDAVTGELVDDTKTKENADGSGKIGGLDNMESLPGLSAGDVSDKWCNAIEQVRLIAVHAVKRSPEREVVENLSQLIDELVVLVEEFDMSAAARKKKAINEILVSWREETRELRTFGTIEEGFTTIEAHIQEWPLEIIDDERIESVICLLNELIPTAQNYDSQGIPFLS